MPRSLAPPPPLDRERERSSVTDLALSPAGHLLFLPVAESAAGADSPLDDAPGVAANLMSERRAAEVAAAFAPGAAPGLLQLAALPPDQALPPACAWWRRFCEQYLTVLCRTPEPAEDLRRPIAPPPGALDELAHAAPPMRGGEYLRAETLERLWSELDAHARAEVAADPGGLSAWLAARNPLWHRVGRVCFHLAENPRDPAFPFAFLATYAPRLLDGRRVQYQPLGKALEEYAGARNHKGLAALLAPVQRAGERCPWVAALADSGEVFHPLRWTPQEAHRFLRDLPVLEESGLLARVPDWWTRRAPRVRATVSLGDTAASRFGAEAMLAFSVGLTLDGETLTPEEWERIRAGTDGLVLLKGRWVEVDRERLSAALDRWKQVAKEAGGDGISFIAGMRLLAGAPIDAEQAGLLEGETALWSEVRAGTWLEERLRELRRPAELAADLPGPELQATLRPYQEVGVRWLRFLTGLGLGACLADDMGLGKTIQVIALLLLRRRDAAMRPAVRRRPAAPSAGVAPAPAPAPAPALLVVPASLLGNWQAELARFAPSLVVRFVHPSRTPPDELKFAAADPPGYVHGADLVITTYAMLLRQEWLAGLPWGLAVLDEAQAIKNPSARQTRAVKKLRAQAKIVLTGTPVENRLGDLWSLFDFLAPGLLGGPTVFRGFLKRMEKGVGEPYAPLRRLVGPYILRRLKTDKSIIADLPDKTEVPAFCRLSKRQAVLYAESVGDLREALGEADGMKRRGVVLAFLQRFKQICNHPAHWLGSGAYAPEESGKFLRLRELAEEIAARQEKVLVFSQFREITEPLAAFLGTIFGRPGLVLHGEVAVGARQRLVEEFAREEGPPFFVLSLKAGGTGLNLTAATHVVHFDRWWNPAVENQATDRAYRIGQKRNVLVHKFICPGTVEARIDALIREKSTLAAEVLEGGAPRLITELNDRELLDLVRLDATTIGEE
ncbi:MAG: DEAD/DEAH box helicase [Planctomycetes bacterium]|nr:DEAD/DEAH box helicase [Planctomycetota bacterium]